MEETFFLFYPQLCKDVFCVGCSNMCWVWVTLRALDPPLFNPGVSPMTFVAETMLWMLPSYDLPPPISLCVHSFPRWGVTTGKSCSTPCEANCVENILIYAYVGDEDSVQEVCSTARSWAFTVDRRCIDIRAKRHCEKEEGHPQSIIMCNLLSTFNPLSCQLIPMKLQINQRNIFSSVRSAICVFQKTQQNTSLLRSFRLSEAALSSPY